MAPNAGPYLPSLQVLHPGLLSQVQVDLLLLKMGSRALGLLPGFQWLSLPEIVEEFEKLMTQQVNSLSSISSELQLVGW